jgi:predicted thioesterase
LKSPLGDNELSVGVNVNVNHLAATLKDEVVHVIAIYKGMEGKFYMFEVELNDKGGIAGKGTHTRAIVKTERLLQGALNRMKGGFE